MEAIFSREEEATYGCCVCLGRGWVPCLNLRKISPRKLKTRREFRGEAKKKSKRLKSRMSLRLSRLAFAAFADSPNLQFPFSSNNSFIAEIIQP